MRLAKIMGAFYWVPVLTLIIYFVRTYMGNWIMTLTYLKQHGTLENRPGICVPVPPFIVDYFVLIIGGIAFYWIKGIRARFQTRDQLTNRDIIEFALYTAVCIIPFLYFDAKLLQVIAQITNDYFSVNSMNQ